MAWFQVNFFSVSLGRQVGVHVLLPAEMPGPIPATGREEAGKQKFKTLYLLHGYMGNANDWLINTQINELSQQYGLAVVMPSGDNGFYVDQPTSGVKGAGYIGQELVEYTRKIFPLSDKKEDTIIAGLSMGGYGAIRNGLAFSDTFGHIIGLSSALVIDTIKDIGEEVNMLGVNIHYYERIFGDPAKVVMGPDDPRSIAKNLLESGKELPDLYFACGYNDSLSNANRDLHRYLDSIGFAHVYEEGPGTHEWPFWRKFLARGLERVLGKPAGGFLNPFFIDNYDPEFDVIGKEEN